MFAVLCPSKKTQIWTDVQILLTFGKVSHPEVNRKMLNREKTFSKYILLRRNNSVLIHNKIKLWDSI
jgi:hypothetical protein